MDTAKIITVETTVDAPVEKVWKYWSEPQHITKWNQASDDWHCPTAENDLRTGGKFSSTMAAKDGSFSFEFGGEYTEVIPGKYIAYQMGDGRKVEVVFTPEDNKTHIRESFEPENTHPADFQQKGWKLILDNFRKYTEEQ